MRKDTNAYSKFAHFPSEKDMYKQGFDSESDYSLNDDIFNRSIEEGDNDSEDLLDISDTNEKSGIRKDKNLGEHFTGSNLKVLKSELVMKMRLFETEMKKENSYILINENHNDLAEGIEN